MGAARAASRSKRTSSPPRGAPFAARSLTACRACGELSCIPLPVLHARAQTALDAYRRAVCVRVRACACVCVCVCVCVCLCVRAWECESHAKLPRHSVSAAWVELDWLLEQATSCGIVLRRRATADASCLAWSHSISTRQCGECGGAGGHKQPRVA